MDLFADDICDIYLEKNNEAVQACESSGIGTRMRQQGLFFCCFVLFFVSFLYWKLLSEALANLPISVVPDVLTIVFVSHHNALRWYS
jgi:hypothetical protein